MKIFGKFTEKNFLIKSFSSTFAGFWWMMCEFSKSLRTPANSSFWFSVHFEKPSAYSLKLDWLFLTKLLTLPGVFIINFGKYNLLTEKLTYFLMILRLALLFGLLTLNMYLATENFLGADLDVELIWGWNTDFGEER